MAHPSFRIISTTSKSLGLKDWLSDEHANMFFAVVAQPMSREEETAVLLSTHCSPEVFDKLLTFADKYRHRMASDSVLKNRKLGTRALVRIARRMAMFPAGQDDLHSLISRSILAEFLPTTEKINLEGLFEECEIRRRPLVVGYTTWLQLICLSDRLCSQTPQLLSKSMESCSPIQPTPSQRSFLVSTPS